MKTALRTTFGVLLLAGCAQASDSGPMITGPDSYTIVTQASFNGVPANTMALREANAYCSHINRRILLDRFQGSSTDAQIYFFCLTPDDARLVQQHMHSVTEDTYSLPQPAQNPPEPVQPVVQQQAPSPPVEVVQAPEPPPEASHKVVRKPASVPLTKDQEFERAMSRLRQQTQSQSEN